MSACWPAPRKCCAGSACNYPRRHACTGDMGFASQKTYDIEVWLRGRDVSRDLVLLELRRLPGAPHGRALPRQGKPHAAFRAHAQRLQGQPSAAALIAVMETYQQQGGSIAVPDVLQRYMGGMQVVERGE